MPIKYWAIHLPSLPVNGMAIFPFILIKDKSRMNDLCLIRHEQIHLLQQAEMLLIPFYVAYFFNYVINLIKYKNHANAYFNIIFEKEAYANEKDILYLKKRRFWGFLSYL